MKTHPKQVIRVCVLVLLTGAFVVGSRLSYAQSVHGSPDTYEETQNSTGLPQPLTTALSDDTVPPAPAADGSSYESDGTMLDPSVEP